MSDYAVVNIPPTDGVALVSTNDSGRRLRGKRRVSWISDANLSDARLNAESSAGSGFAPRDVTHDDY